MPRRTLTKSTLWNSPMKLRTGALMPRIIATSLQRCERKAKKWEQAYDCMHSACCELSDKCDRLTAENEAWQKSLITQKENADKAYYELACSHELKPKRL